MVKISNKLFDTGLGLGMTEGEIAYMAKAINSDINRIVGECNGLDQQIAYLTTQRAAKQVELEDAQGVAKKLGMVMPGPTPPDVPVQLPEVEQ